MEAVNSDTATQSMFNISYGSATERTSRSTTEGIKKKIDFLYKEVVEIRKNLEPVKGNMRLGYTTEKYDMPATARSSSVTGLAKTAGQTADADKVMSGVSQFSSVSSGTLVINGTNISVDVSTDSLNDVISRISASGAGVTASISNAHQFVTISEDDNSSTLTLSSGGTGFFSALNITEGTSNPSNGYRTSSTRNVMPKARAARVANSLEEFARAFNAIFDDDKIKVEKDSDLGTYLSEIRDDVKGAVQEVFDTNVTDIKTDYGIEFDFGTSATSVFDFSLTDRLDFISKLSTEGSDVNDLFYGVKRKKDDGLIEKIIDTLQYHENFLKDLSTTTGTGVDISA